MLTSKSQKTLITTQPNQPSDAPERTQRHLRMCAELADLAMGLARAAAARTLADWAEPEQPPAAEPQLNESAEPQLNESAEPQLNESAEPQLNESAEPQPVQSAEPLSQPAETQAARAPAPHINSARSRQASRPATPSSTKPTDPAVLFTRLAAVVRECITLEARIAAGTTCMSRAPARQPPDPRRAKLQEALRLVTTGLPDRAAVLRETTSRADEHLAADPDQTIEIPDLLIDVCEELGIEINFKTLPDEFLFTTYDPPDYNDDFDDAAPPPAPPTRPNLSNANHNETTT